MPHRPHHHAAALLGRIAIVAVLAACDAAPPSGPGAPATRAEHADAAVRTTSFAFEFAPELPAGDVGRVLDRHAGALSRLGVTVTRSTTVAGRLQLRVAGPMPDAVADRVALQSLFDALGVGQ